MKNIYKTAILILAAIIAPIQALCTEQIVLEPLFQVPEVPPEYEDIGQRSNYLMANYWRNMDFKQKFVDQYRLNEAVYVYLVAMQWAADESVEKSLDALFKNLSKNPALLYQFTKAAEEVCYGDRARISADRIYLRFLDALLSNKKVKDLRKTRYRLHRTRIANSLIGNPLPEFTYTDRYSVDKKFTPGGRPTLLIFGYPDCDDCRLVTLRLQTDSRIDKAISDGQLAIFYIIPTVDDDQWRSQVADYPDKWEIGAGTDLDDTIDMRFRPSMYLLDADGKITAKNISLDEALKAATMNN